MNDLQIPMIQPDDGLWIVEEITCNRCGHEWIAVYPRGTEECECSQCGYEQPTGAEQ